MTVTEEQVREALRKVIDPELFVNIVDLGLIYVIDLQDGEAGVDSPDAAPGSSASVENSSPAADNSSPAADDASSAADENQSVAASGPGTHVKIDMTMTSPMCPAGPQLVGNSKQVVSQIEGVGNVEVRVVMDPPWTPDRMTDDARDQLGIF